MTELKINEKFRDLLDLPSDAERKELERQLIRDGGPRDKIIVWKEQGVIVDGHNRYAICKAHNLKFGIENRSFKDEDEVVNYILENQLGRRNLSPSRATYYLGMLYNKQKQADGKMKPHEDGKTTSERLGEQFGVDEKTVRRAGDVATGLDRVAEVKGVQSIKDRLQLLRGKNDESFTKGELEELGKVKDDTVAKEAAKIMVDQKKEEAKVKKTVAETKKAQPKAKPEPAKKPETYPVAFCKPQFDRMGWSLTSEDKPPMAENCMVYMAVPDEELMKGLDLLRKWGLEYQATFVFKADRYEGLWTDITHTFMIAASRGTMAGPKKAVQSLNSANGSVDQAMIKLIETYHPGVKRIDMRKNVTADGWAKMA